MNSNKSFLIGKLIALLLLLAVIVTISIYFISGSSRNFNLSWNFNTRSEENLVASKEFSGIEEINVNTASYAIRVEEYSGDKVKAEFYCTDSDGKDFVDFSQDGTTLNIKQKSNSEFMNFYSASVVVLVPTGSAYDYQLNTASGSIRLEAASKDAAISSASGSIRVTEDGNTLKVTSVSGSVRASGAFVSTDINSTSGSVRAVADERAESIYVNSVSGSVKVMLDGVKDYTLDASSTSGSIRDEYTDARFERYGSEKVGSGKVEVSVHSTSGSIRLEDWND